MGRRAEPKRGRKGLIILAMGLIALLGAGLFIGWLAGRPQGEALTTPGTAMALDPDARPDVPEDTPAPAGEIDGVAIAGVSFYVLPAGKETVPLELSNPGANQGRYYLSYELYLMPQRELLYASGLIAPGSSVQEVTLARALEAGEYEALLVARTFRMDGEQAPGNSAQMQLRLLVE